MLALIPPTFGNRCADLFGNTHVLVTTEGMPVFRSPGRYVGRHRRPEQPWVLDLLAPMVYYRKTA